MADGTDDELEALDGLLAAAPRPRQVRRRYQWLALLVLVPALIATTLLFGHTLWRASGIPDLWQLIEDSYGYDNA